MIGCSKEISTNCLRVGFSCFQHFTATFKIAVKDPNKAVSSIMMFISSLNRKLTTLNIIGL